VQQAAAEYCYCYCYPCSIPLRMRKMRSL
jgi:hypothetical protein